MKIRFNESLMAVTHTNSLKDNNKGIKKLINLL